MANTRVRDEISAALAPSLLPRAADQAAITNSVEVLSKAMNHLWIERREQENAGTKGSKGSKNKGRPPKAISRNDGPSRHVQKKKDAAKQDRHHKTSRQVKLCPKPGKWKRTSAHGPSPKRKKGAKQGGRGRRGLRLGLELLHMSSRQHAYTGWKVTTFRNRRHT